MTKQGCSTLPVVETYNKLYCDRLIETTGVHQLGTTGIRPRQVYGILIQNDPDSANSVYVGDALQQFFEVEPGGVLTVPVDRVERVYVSFADGAATINWLAVG